MDDPTAAVDAWVGNHLFNDCVCNTLADTTRIYITNHIDQAKDADQVLVMAGGKVVAQGTYNELLHSNATFRELCDAYSNSKEEEEEGKGDEQQPGEADRARAAKARNKSLAAAAKAKSMLSRKEHDPLDAVREGGGCGNAH